MTEPSGLEGELMRIILVFLVISSATLSGDMRYSSSSFSVTNLALAPAIRTQASKVPQDGSGTMTSSPSSTMASMAMKMACLVGVMSTCLSSQGMPFSFRLFSATAFLSSGMPADGV